MSDGFQAPAGAPGDADIVLGSIVFPMFLQWPDADVDIMLTERGSAFQPDRRVTGGRTPTSASIERFYLVLSEDAKLREAGIKVDSTYAFCQGVARVDFAVELPFAKVNTLSSCIRKAQQRMRMLARKTVRYYEDGETVRSTGVMVVGA